MAGVEFELMTVTRLRLPLAAAVLVLVLLAFAAPGRTLEQRDRVYHLVGPYNVARSKAFSVTITPTTIPGARTCFRSSPASSSVCSATCSSPSRCPTG